MTNEQILKSKGTYKGKPIEEYTKEELIEIIAEMGGQLEQLHNDVNEALSL